MKNMNSYKFLSTVAVLLLAVFLNMQTVSAAQTLTMLKGKPPAPNFKLEDQEGNMVQLSDYKGKVVIVNFWATWCPPCLKEMPSMQRAWEILQKEDIIMLAINVGEDSDAIFAFTAEYPLDFPLLMDRTSGVSRDWRVRGLPSTYVIDPQGRIIFQAIGGREWDSDEIMNRVRSLKE